MIIKQKKGSFDMKVFKKLILLLIVLSMTLIFTPHFSFAENAEVNSQDTLVEAIQNAENGDTISLTEDIVLISPVTMTDKTITINGNGHSISSVSTNWTSEGPNGSLITAGSGARLTLTNITLKDAQKYGVQSYNGAHVILDGVTVVNNKFGGVLVNAGTVEVINLNLGYNGESKNNGIEIGKGEATGDKIPELVMNGTIYSSESENVIYIAENNDDLTQFNVSNGENAVNKIFIQGNKVVVADANNNIIYTSNAADDLTLAGQTFVETPEPTPAPSAKDETPKTGTDNSLTIAISILVVSIISIAILKKEF